MQKKMLKWLPKNTNKNEIMYNGLKHKEFDRH